MHISSDIRYVGVDDHALDLFESQYAVPDGMAYNSYVILDERIAVMDSVERGFGALWLRQIRETIGDRSPDYLIVQHMEPDHSGNIAAFMAAYPEARVVASAKAFAMMKAFFGEDYAARRIVVKEGDTLSLGRHVLSFLAAPMVHWPEVLVTYDAQDKVLFSADAFGKFGALDVPQDWTDEARRYYIGIVGKYGVQVQALLKKVASLDVKILCPLHGPVLGGDLTPYLSLYDTWSSYRPEAPGVMIACSSIYGHTTAAAQQLAQLLRAAGRHAVVYDLARCDMTQAIAEAFRYDHLVLASATYNGDVFPPMRAFLSGLTERGFCRRTVGLMENGSWAPMAAKVMRGLLEKSRDLTFCETTVKIASALDDASRAQLSSLAKELCP